MDAPFIHIREISFNKWGIRMNIKDIDDDLAAHKN